MTKLERQTKLCFLCSKRESDHPGGRFCTIKEPNDTMTDPICLPADLIDDLIDAAEELLSNIRTQHAPDTERFEESLKKLKKSR